MCDEPENPSPIEKIGEMIYEILPECLQTEEFAESLGSFCGFWSAFFMGRAITRLLFHRDKEDEK